MLNQKKIIVVMPAYNAASTLEKTYREIPHDIVDDVEAVTDEAPPDPHVDEPEVGAGYLFVVCINELYVDVLAVDEFCRYSEAITYLLNTTG